jgi:hypothetical protein
MRKIGVVMISALLVTLLCLSCGPREKGADGLVTYVEGDVEIMRAGTDSFEEINPGQFVGMGDTIRTGSGSLVDIKLGEASVLRLKEDTTLYFEEYESSVKSIIAKLKLVSGVILNRIQKLKRKSSFEITTRVAVAGIRGTDFMVESAEEDVTKVLVLDGKVEVRSTTIEAPPIVVGYHEKTLVYKGSPPRPAEDLLMDEIEQLKEINAINFSVVLKVARAVAELSEVKNLKTLLEHFCASEGAYPQELQELVEKGYTRKLPKDRWGSDLYYSISEDGRTYVLISPGPDRRLGNDDDIEY